MRTDDTFTFTEMRVALVAFAKWLELVGMKGKEVELVDRFISVTTEDVK